MILLGVVVASWWAGAAAAGGSCEEAGGGGGALLTAVLPLHSGTDCAHVNLRGLQQLAALRQAVADVNTDLKAQDGLSIGLRWEDSCQGAVGAALRLLVDSQQTCPQHPLHIGMVGPEEDGALSRVLAVTGAFNVTHVLPRATAHHHTAAQHDAVLSVTVDRLAEQAQSVAAAVRAVGWRGFGLAFQEPQAALAEAVARLADEDAALCVKGSPARIDPSFTLPLPLPTGSDGTVVLVESGEEAGRVLASTPASRPLLLLVRRVGLEAWQLPPDTPLFLMQQTSATDPEMEEAMNATLQSQLAAQREARCEHSGQTAACRLQDPLSEVSDESVTALSDAVRLMAAALHTTCRGGGGCGRVSAAEWRGALRRATATRRDTARLRFNMDVPSAYTLYTRHADTLLQVATVSGGVLKRTAGFAFPPPSADAGQCDGPPSPPATAPSPTLKDLYTTDYAFYELVGMICGVGFIMFAVMVVIIYVIYNSLVEKGEKESTGGSVESRVGRRPAPPRRNLRDTFRRGSSIRSSTHS